MTRVKQAFLTTYDNIAYERSVTDLFIISGLNAPDKIRHSHGQTVAAHPNC